MDRKVLMFIALAASMLYGVSFVVFADVSGYAPIGGVIVALLWIAVGVFGKDSPKEPDRVDR